MNFPVELRLIARGYISQYIYIYITLLDPIGWTNPTYPTFRSEMNHVDPGDSWGSDSELWLLGLEILSHVG